MYMSSTRNRTSTAFRPRPLRWTTRVTCLSTGAGAGAWLLVFALWAGLTASCKGRTHTEKKPSVSKSPKTKQGPPARLQRIIDLKNGFIQYQVKTPDGAMIHVYGNQLLLDANKKAPLLLVVSGSGCASIFHRRKDGTFTTGLTGFFLRGAKDRYAVAVLEKRGVKLGDSVVDSEQKCSLEYHKHTGFDARVADHLLIVKALKEVHSKIIVVGHSEGSDVAAGIAAGSNDISMLGIMSGGGTSQMFDFAMGARKKIKGMSPSKAEEFISSLFAQFEDVFKNPQSHTKQWHGHPYSRWHSYFTRAPIESLLKVKVPIFMVHGSDDTSVRIESSDFVYLEFLRHGKKNLTYRRYPGLDHSLACDTSRPGCDPKKRSRFPKVVSDLLTWVESGGKTGPIYPPVPNPAQVRKTEAIQSLIRSFVLVAKDRGCIHAAGSAFKVAGFNASTSLEALPKAKTPQLVVIIEDQNFDWKDLPTVTDLPRKQIARLIRLGTPFLVQAKLASKPLFIFGLGKDKSKRLQVLKGLLATPKAQIKPGQVVTRR